MNPTFESAWPDSEFEQETLDSPGPGSPFLLIPFRFRVQPRKQDVRSDVPLPARIGNPSRKPYRKLDSPGQKPWFFSSVLWGFLLGLAIRPGTGMSDRTSPFLGCTRTLYGSDSFPPGQLRHHLNPTFGSAWLDSGSSRTRLIPWVTLFSYSISVRVQTRKQDVRSDSRATSSSLSAAIIDRVHCHDH